MCSMDRLADHSAEYAMEMEGGEIRDGRQFFEFQGAVEACLDMHEHPQESALRSLVAWPVFIVPQHLL